MQHLFYLLFFGKRDIKKKFEFSFLITYFYSCFSLFYFLGKFPLQVNTTEFCCLSTKRKRWWLQVGVYIIYKHLVSFPLIFLWCMNSTFLKSLFASYTKNWFGTSILGETGKNKVKFNTISFSTNIITY